MKPLYLTPVYRFTTKSIHIDWPLLGLLLTLITFGLFVLHSASNESHHMLLRQSFRVIFAFLVMFVFAMIPPHKYKNWAPFFFSMGLGLLLLVMVLGKVGKGAQRWLAIGSFRFEPSEIMKLAMPLMIAWYLDKKNLLLTTKHLSIAFGIIFIPALLIAKQPDLGTAIMVSTSGLSALFVAGLSFRFLTSAFFAIVLIAPCFWFILHDYQKQRILTLLHPEADPLGTGYHIIQSKIAIGSGGVFGKGWLLGSQAHLNFLPEHATDFIFAVSAEEFGLMGGCFIIVLMACIALRGLRIAKTAQTDFTRLLAASLAMTFFLSGFVNIGMVMGILPVVGIPLPLVSYGGTAMLTFLASFGMLMSISTHRILFHMTSR